MIVTLKMGKRHPSKFEQDYVCNKCNLSLNCQRIFNSKTQCFSLSLILVALCNQHRTAMLVEIRKFEEEEEEKKSNEDNIFPLPCAFV